MKCKQKVDVYWSDHCGPVVRAEDYRAVCDEAEKFEQENKLLRARNRRLEAERDLWKESAEKCE